MPPLEDVVDSVARATGFAGVVSVDRGGENEFAKAYGLAHRGHKIANTVDTRFAIASGTKALTALAVVSLIEQGVLDLSTTARSVLGEDLPLIDDGVTVEHLLAHRSGIGDYFDEEAGHEITDYALPVPVHALTTTEQYLAVLGGHPRKFAPGERFSYCNGGYVVLALIAERVGGRPFHDLVRDRVCEPASMRDTEFPRSDEPPERTALGYLPIEGVSRTNLFHLPVRGSGDGGISTTVRDLGSFWRALLGGTIVSPSWVAEMLRPRSEVPSQSRRYGLGFWLPEWPGSKDAVMLEGYDPGVSFRSVHRPQEQLTHTVISNSSPGAWPITRLLENELTAGPPSHAVPPARER
jgi:CubicO group peptidase (beta-lactamase class C family)